MLDWDNLRYVLAVRRAGSLNAAARTLQVDKATVSRRIAAAEQALGVRLFDRKPDGYGLTPHGQRALASLASIDDSIADLVRDLAEARGDVQGTVYLSVPQFFASEVLFPELTAFRTAHPNVDLIINASSSIVDVARREAEVGLRNVKPKQLSVTVKRVGKLALALYASRAYLARRGTPSRPDDLASHDLIGWPTRFSHANGFRWVDDLAARMPVRVNDAAVLCNAALANLGIAGIPCFLGDAHRELVRLETFGTIREDIFAVAPGELRRSGRVRAVIDLLAHVWRKHATRLAG